MKRGFRKQRFQSKGQRNKPKYQYVNRGGMRL